MKLCSKSQINFSNALQINHHPSLTVLPCNGVSGNRGNRTATNGRVTGYPIPILRYPDPSDTPIPPIPPIPHNRTKISIFGKMGTLQLMNSEIIHDSDYIAGWQYKTVRSWGNAHGHRLINQWRAGQKCVERQCKWGDLWCRQTHNHRHNGKIVYVEW